IVRLEAAGVQLNGLPHHRDRWREQLLAISLRALDEREMLDTGSSAGDVLSRGQNAKRAAEEVAKAQAQQPEFATGPLALPRAELHGIQDQALKDAVRLNLLWHGHEQVGFAGDDLGAYLTAAALTKPDRLLDRVGGITPNGRAFSRRDRYA